MKWNGAEQLRDWLIPVGDVEPFPGNPRRGSVADIAESLQRWGQTMPILTDGERIVAGNHTYLAARELGWTHIAAAPNKFASEAEARAYLLADNRLSDVADYDRLELMAALEEVEARGSWTGTGYEIDDLEDLRAALDRVSETFGGGHALALGTAVREVVLLLDIHQAASFETHMRILRKEYGVSAVSEIVLRALRERAAAA